MKGVVALNRDWLTTARQSLPRLGQIVRNMRPTWRFADISKVSADQLVELGIEAALWDVDGTLMSYHGDEIDPCFYEQIRSLFRDSRIRHGILSNCGEERFLMLGRIFPEAPVMRGYRGPRGEIVFRVLRGNVDSLTSAVLADLLAGGARPIRKPDGLLIQRAMETLGVLDPGRVVMIGDQYMTDVASANLAGARSIKVETFRRDTFPLPVKLSQHLERAVYVLFHGRPREDGTRR